MLSASTPLGLFVVFCCPAAVDRSVGRGRSIASAAGVIDKIVFLCVFAASDHVLPHKCRDLIGYALSRLHSGAE